MAGAEFQPGKIAKIPGMTIYDWKTIPTESLNPLVTRQAIHMNGLTIARLRLTKDARVPEHSHVHEQVSSVEKGALEFSFPDRQVVVRDGQSVAIPSNLPHSVVALEDTVVVDVFSPCREDWM